MNFSQKNILFRISPTFFVYVYIFSYIDAGNISSELLLAMLVHELGHIVTVSILKKRLSEVVLSIFGVHISVCGNSHETPLEGLLTSSSGILANLMIAICFLEISPKFSACNIAVALYNAIPAKGLDGNRILENLILQIFGYTLGQRLYYTFSVGLCAILALWGIFYIIFIAVNLSVLTMCAYCLWSIIVQLFEN